MDVADSLEFDWALFAMRVVHPLRVSIIEALLWVGTPLSASDLSKLFDNEPEHNISLVSYHLKKLESDGAVVEADVRPVRGFKERFYAIPDDMLRRR